MYAVVLDMYACLVLCAVVLRAIHIVLYMHVCCACLLYIVMDMHVMSAVRTCVHVCFSPGHACVL